MVASDAERIKAIQKALCHPMFYDGDMGADIRWLLALVEPGTNAVAASSLYKPTRHGGNLLIPYYLQAGQPEPEYDQGHSVVVWYDDLYDLAKSVTKDIVVVGGVKFRRNENGDVVCVEHGTAIDVHCCNCHNGFIFDADHECPEADK